MQKKIDKEVEKRKAIDKPTTYQDFIKHSKINSIIKNILNNALYYSYDNTIFNIIQPQKESMIFKNKSISESFEKAIKQLNINKSLNNPQLDVYLYTLLTNGKLNLKLTQEQYKIVDENYDISVLLKENYIESLYQHYVVENNSVSKSSLFIDEEIILKDLRNAISLVIRNATNHNLTVNNNVVSKFILKTFRIYPQFNISLNDDETLLYEYQSFDAIRDKRFIDEIKDGSAKSK